MHTLKVSVFYSAIKFEQFALGATETPRSLIVYLNNVFLNGFPAADEKNQTKEHSLLCQFEHIRPSGALDLADFADDIQTIYAMFKTTPNGAVPIHASSVAARFKDILKSEGLNYQTADKLLKAMLVSLGTFVATEKVRPDYFDVIHYVQQSCSSLGDSIEMDFSL